MLWFACLMYIVDLFGVSFRVVVVCILVIWCGCGCNCGFWVVWLFGWVWVAGVGCVLLYLGLVICCVAFWFVLVGLVLDAGVCNVCTCLWVLGFCELCFTALFCCFGVL